MTEEEARARPFADLGVLSAAGTIGALVDEWLVATGSTSASYRGGAKRIRGVIGPAPVYLLTGPAVAAYQRARRESGGGKSSVDVEAAVLRAVITWGRETGILGARSDTDGHTEALRLRLTPDELAEVRAVAEGLGVPVVYAGAAILLEAARVLAASEGRG